MEAMPAAASHLLIVQDDALLCEDFAARAVTAVTARPDVLLALFVPGFPFMARRVERQRLLGEAFADLPPAAFTPVVAMSYPRAHVEALLAYSDASRWPRATRMGTADDAIVAGYVRANRLSVVATVPSLVEHRDEIPSIAKPSHRQGRHRRAAWFA